MDHSHIVSGPPLTESYSAPLIVLSILIAILSSFTAFGTAERQYNASQKSHKIAWNIFGATAMGMGIWAMHFIGMLAFSLSVPVSYDVFITILSIFPAILACSVVLNMMTQRKSTSKKVVVGGILLGLGIGLMHYIGMAAMRMNATMVHDTFLFLLSLVVAIIFAAIALKVKQDIHIQSPSAITKRHVVSAIVMGAATSSMHYIAMASADFYPQESTNALLGISSNALTVIVSIVAVLILFIAISVPYFMRYREVTEELDSNLKRLNLALGSAKQAWFDYNPQTNKMSTSDGYLQLLDYDPKKFEGGLERWMGGIHPDDVDQVTASLDKTLNGDEPVEYEYRRQAKDGSWIWLHSVGEVIERDQAHQATRVIGIKTDITERKQREQVLRMLAESNVIGDANIFKLIVKQLASSQNVRYAFIACFDQDDEDKSKIEILAAWEGYRHRDNTSYLLHKTPCEQVLKKGVCFYPENVQSLFPDDKRLKRIRAVSYLGVPLTDEQGNVFGLLAIIDNKPMDEKSYTTSLLESLAVRVTIELERINATKKLDLTSQVFSETSNGIVISDESNVIIDVNPAFSKITGYSREEAVGQNPKFLSSKKHDDKFYLDMWESIKTDGRWSGEVWNSKKNGDLYMEALTVSELKSRNNEEINYLGIFVDITESKRQQEELERMAHYDLLTKLPNRALFADRFYQAIAYSKRSGSLLAICFLDLDNFKPINDNYGHDVGDLLLIEVADRIKKDIREEDTISRQGGDEFALLLGDLDSVEQCQQMLVRLKETLSRPYIINDYTHKISASIGVTLYPNDNADLDILMRHADQAMYQAKIDGRGRYHLFNIQDNQKITEKQTQLEAVQEALLNNEFYLYYQPKVNMRTGKVFGVEALIRWSHPEKGLLLPFEFLPAIEGSTVENLLGDWVVSEALGQLNKWREEGVNLEVSINISSQHLQSELFLSHLDSTLEQYPEVKSSNLQLEILESSALGDLVEISNVIKICSEVFGVNVALDDFGTGYSSLTHLRSLPVSVIKIDRSFVRDVLEDLNDRTIIEGVIGLATSFDRKIIAEGVETLQHGLMLLLMGCDAAQGYHIARPMPANEIVQWLISYQSNKDWISYGKHNYSRKDKRLQLLELITEQWLKRFERNIQISQKEIEFWPVTKATKCPRGLWIKGEKRDESFDQNWLDILSVQNREMCSIAEKLKEQYLSGNIEGARKNLKQLRLAFDRSREITRSKMSQPWSWSWSKR